MRTGSVIRKGLVGVILEANKERNKHVRIKA